MNPSSQRHKKEIALITVEILRAPCMLMFMQGDDSPHSSFLLSMWHCFNILDVGVLEIAQLPYSKKVECLIPCLGLFCM